MRHAYLALLLTALLPATSQAWSWRESRAVSSAVRSAVKMARTQGGTGGATGILATAAILQPQLKVRHVKRLMGELGSSESQTAVAESFVARADVSMADAIAVAGEIKSFWAPRYIGLQVSIREREQHIGKLQRGSRGMYYKPTLAIADMRSMNERDQATVDGYRSEKNHERAAARDAVLMSWAKGRRLSSQAWLKLAGNASTDVVRARFERQAVESETPFTE